MGSVADSLSDYKGKQLAHWWDAAASSSVMKSMTSLTTDAKVGFWSLYGEAADFVWAFRVAHFDYYWIFLIMNREGGAGTAWIVDFPTKGGPRGKKAAAAAGTVCFLPLIFSYLRGN